MGEELLTYKIWTLAVYDRLMLKKEKIATLCLILGAFFNPFGFDAALWAATKLMGGYWNAIILFYCLLVLFFGLYYYYRKNIYLVLALFINPFGYDILFHWTMSITGAFWIANSIFYAIALMFFAAYFLIVKQNPVIYIIDTVKIGYSKIRGLFDQNLA